jgi:hypothetical protein
MSKPTDLPPESGTLSSEQLCAITGWTTRHLRRLAALGKFPPPIDGRYQAGKTLVGVITHLLELVRKKSNKLAKEQVALTKARREMVQEELAVIREKYEEKAVIGPALRNVSLHQRAVLQRMLEQELAPKLANLTTLEILPLMKAAVDTVCAVFRERVAGWMDAPPEVGAESAITFPASGKGSDATSEASLLPASPGDASDEPITNPAPIVTEEPQPPSVQSA